MFKKLFKKLGKKNEEEKELEIEEIGSDSEDESTGDTVEEKQKPGETAEADSQAQEAIAESDSEAEASEPEKKDNLQAEEKQPVSEEENKQQETADDTIEEQKLEEDEQEEEKQEAKAPSFNLFSRLKEGLSKTKKGITERIDTVLTSYGKIDEELFEELEEILITSDMGFETTMKIIDRLKERVKRNKVTQASMVREELKEVLVEMLSEGESAKLIQETPAIILVIGVNGVGKTTTIGKMANRFKGEGKNVLIAAGDTFRAAAIDQLEVWAERTGVEIVSHSEGSDPGAVIFDALQAAKSRNADVLICDTAGRLHNKKNLMNELGKIFKIVEREYPNASREVLLVVDATTGQNAVQQAKLFNEVADITGIVLTKLDGTAKGGVILAVKSEIGVPVKLIGVGEKVEDLQDFDPRNFVEALFE